VDSSRLGVDSRISLSHDTPPLPAIPWEDGSGHAPQSNAHQSSNHLSHPHGQRGTNGNGFNLLPLGPTGSVESWFDKSHHPPPGGAMTSMAPSFQVQAFTNPFAGDVSGSRNRPAPLRITTSSPTSRPLPLAPPVVEATGLYVTTVSPTESRNANDPASPSWVAPESWGVKKQDADDDVGSISGESENLQLQEPTRNTLALPVDDEQSHDLHSTLGRQHSLQSSTLEYKIRVICEIENGPPPLVFKIPYQETAQSFIKSKFYSKSRLEGECRLWIRDRGRGLSPQSSYHSI
jgi:hypothetical protein